MLTPRPTLIHLEINLYGIAPLEKNRKFILLIEYRIKLLNIYVNITDTDSYRKLEKYETEA